MFVGHLQRHKLGSSTLLEQISTTQQKKARSYGKKTPKEMAEFAIHPLHPLHFQLGKPFCCLCVFVSFLSNMPMRLPIDLLVRLLKKVERSSSNSKESLLTNQCSAVPTLWKVLVPCWSTFVLPGSCTKNSVPKPIHLLNRLAQPILSGTSYTYTWHIMALLRC